MVKSPRGRCGPAPAGLGTGGAMIGPVPTTLALAGSAVAACAWAAPGREGAALCARATAQVPISNAPASFITFFIGVLGFRRCCSGDQERLEIAVQRQFDLGLVRFGAGARPAAGAARCRARVG